MEPTTPVPVPGIQIWVAAGERAQVEFQLECRRRGVRVRWLGRSGAEVGYAFPADGREKVRAAARDAGVSVERWARTSWQS